MHRPVACHGHVSRRERGVHDPLGVKRLESREQLEALLDRPVAAFGHLVGRRGRRRHGNGRDGGSGCSIGCGSLHLQRALHRRHMVAQALHEAPPEPQIGRHPVRRIDLKHGRRDDRRHQRRALERSHLRACQGDALAVSARPRQQHHRPLLHRVGRRPARLQDDAAITMRVEHARDAPRAKPILGNGGRHSALKVFWLCTRLREAIPMVLVV